jgi:hypoxanthine-DNA glycosylase
MKGFACKSFPPVVDKRSRVLVLGTMPGPVALKKQEYYGFPGNHFWTIIARLFGGERPETYRERLRLLRVHRIALWDVAESCVRPGSADSAMRDIKINAVDALLKSHPGIRAVFLNGRATETLFRRAFGAGVALPIIYLPSTSPAMASLSIEKKLRAWRALLPFLEE